jgi:hypothetical protein
MPLPTPTRRPVRTVARIAAAVALVLGTLVAASGRASAHSSTTAFNTVPGAPTIGLIGDSTLAGVRWYKDYGQLGRYSFVFDAESCRRTLEPSCWSREGYRADTALQSMQHLSGQLGDVLVMMTGYDDSSYLFDDAIDAVLAEARRQQIGHVVWLTLRTDGVDYEEPLHQANGRTYRDSNKVLLARAAHSGGYLQVADWATYSIGHDDWMEADGVHITAAGADGLTGFIADQVHKVLDGATITPAEPPWYPLVEGDTGEGVTRLQKALVAAGMDLRGGVDGTFGLATGDAVSTFQRQHGLDVTGIADRATATALGLRATAAATTPTTTVPSPPGAAAPGTVAPAAKTASPSTGDDLQRNLPWIGLLVALNVLLAVYVRRRLGRRAPPLTTEESVEDDPVVLREPQPEHR